MSGTHDKPEEGSQAEAGAESFSMAVGEARQSGLVLPEHLSQLVSDPAAMNAIAQKIAAQLNASSASAIQDLPPPVRRRVRALKKLQFEITKLEADFYTAVQRLEAEFQAKYQPFFDKRHDILTGSHEPTDEESHWPADEDDEGEEGKPDDQQQGGGATSATSEDTKTEDVGIPEFWLTALKNADLFAEIIKEHDEAVLSHLTDVKVIYQDDAGLDFNIEFHFSDNEWFTNKVLVKCYQVVCEVDNDTPFEFEGAALTSCKGCKIDWKKGKNITVKTVKKKQKHKGRGQARTVTKTVPNESFFNFFSPPDPEAKDGDLDEEELSQTLADDFVRAEFLRDRLVPKAVLFFTGEAVEEEDEFGDEDEGDEDEEDEDEDDDYDAQQDLQNKKPPECKQQ